MKDMNGVEFKVGQKVAKAYATGDLRILKVVRIIEDKVYLSNSDRNPSNYLYYPNQVLIIDG